MTENFKPSLDAKEELLGDLVLRDGGLGASKPGLISSDEPKEGEEEVAREMEASLSVAVESCAALLQGTPDASKSWESARQTVAQFRPVPWFIWRISNHVFGQPGEARPLGDGALVGLRRLVFAAASDGFLGEGRKVNNVHAALRILKPDTIAAVAVIHATCRRLASGQFERIWRPILDDALLRAQIGFLVGERTPNFGAGRGMLAGFAGRCGLAILLATGKLEQARTALEMLAAGDSIQSVGVTLYGCDPLQVSAMTLSAAGCGRDAAFGTVRFASPILQNEDLNQEQLCWLSAFTVVEFLRVGEAKKVADRYWDALGYTLGQDRADLNEVSASLIRRGHSLTWIV